MPTWSALMDVGGLDPAAAIRGAYAGLVHGIASQSQFQAQAGRNPRSRTPTTPGTPSPRPSGPSPPPWTGKARYVDFVLALI